MSPTGHLFSLLLAVFTCSALANIKLETKKDHSNNGQKRLDIHGK